MGHTMRQRHRVVLGCHCLTTLNIKSLYILSAVVVAVVVFSSVNDEVVVVPEVVAFLSGLHGSSCTTQ